MTYKEKLQELEQEFAKKSDALLKAKNDLTANDFVDAAEREWQFAGNEFHTLEAYVRKNEINLDDPYPSFRPSKKIP